MVSHHEMHTNAVAGTDGTLDDESLVHAQDVTKV